MIAEMQIVSQDRGLAEISVVLPAEIAVKTADAIRSILTLAGHEVHKVNDEKERVYSLEEVFPDLSPAKVLRGLRGKEDLTQEAFARRIGIAQHHISDMETGKRPITLEMAKRIGEAFNVSYKIFL
ncbi:MAG: helix-turn-helix domain-containing protein [Desulfovibrio sp.]|nr:helix-turn-helix domain-containing protein [Desulfovibrio sp.]